MSALDIVELNGAREGEWLALVRQCADYDFYHLPFYHRLAQQKGNGNPVLLYYCRDEHRICLPLLLRHLDTVPGLQKEGRDYLDATSVYGYAGPVSTRGEMPKDVLGGFHDALATVLRELRVVTLFSRMHPLFDNFQLIHGIGECVREGMTVSIDTSQVPEVENCGYRRNHKIGIKELQAMGMNCQRVWGREKVSAFWHIYSEAMQRLKASDEHFYPLGWFEEFLSTQETTTALFLGQFEGKAICGSLVTLCNGVGQIHLAAVANEFVTLSPLKLLFHEIRRWVNHQGGQVLHIGGGFGCKGDSLFNFKAGFSKIRHSFLTWRWVLDESVNDRLVEVVGQSLGPGDLADGAIAFPKYRHLSRRRRDFCETNESSIVNAQNTLGDMHCDNVTCSHTRNTSGGQVESARNLTKPVNVTTSKRGSARRVIIVGGGGHARVIADALLLSSERNARVQLLGYLDDNPTLATHKLLGLRRLGPIDALSTIDHDAVVIGIGDNRTRMRLFSELRHQGERPMTVVHPHAVVARDAKIGIGTVVFAGVVVNSGAVIGNNVILNTACSVDHDCRIASHGHICPGVHLGGTVRVGEGAFIGIGSSVIHNRSIGEWSTIGAGAVVIRDVPPHVVAVGVPARALAGGLSSRSPDDRDLAKSGDLGERDIAPASMQMASSGETKGSPPRKVIVYGAGGFGREIAAALRSGASGIGTEVVCFVDDDQQLQSDKVDELVVLSLEAATGRYQGVPVVCAIADPPRRREAIQKVRQLNMPITSFIHPSAILPRTTRIGVGCIVSAGCILTTNVQLGDFVVLNLQTTLGHDVVVGDYATIGPGVRAGGFVHFEDEVFVGMGAVIVNGTETNPIVVGKGANIGASSCVIRSVPPHETVFGSPARRIPLTPEQ